MEVNQKTSWRIVSIIAIDIYEFDYARILMINMIEITIYTSRVACTIIISIIYITYY